MSESTSPSAAEPRDAATVILLRPREPGFDVLLVRRHAKSGFMANTFVFPGGKCDAADAALDPALCHGIDAAQARAILGRDTALAHFVAALRETWEEAGVLLAVDASSASLTLGPDASGPLDDVLRARDLRLDLGRLRYLSHWVTPTIERRRFSARFFLAAVPAGQLARHDAHETTEHVWLTPSDALSRYAEGTLMMAPPTLRTLETLASARSVDDALALAPHAPVPEILPEFCMADGLACLALPGDPLCTATPGTKRNRFVLETGRWTSIVDD